MRSPAGWSEPAQTPEFDEFTVVLDGLAARPPHATASSRCAPVRRSITHAGEWVQYSTPEGAEYIAVCFPAFAPDTVHRVDD